MNGCEKCGKVLKIEGILWELLREIESGVFDLCCNFFRELWLDEEWWTMIGPLFYYETHMKFILKFTYQLEIQ